MIYRSSSFAPAQVPSAQCPSAQVPKSPSAYTGPGDLDMRAAFEKTLFFPFVPVDFILHSILVHGRSFFDLFLVKEALSGVILTILIIFTIIIFTITILVLGMITVAGYAAAQESLRPFIARRTQPPYSNSNVRLSTSFISLSICVSSIAGNVASWPHGGKSVPMADSIRDSGYVSSIC